ncbi:hypothetical protein [Pseudonocardia sp. ICBG601]|uniref:hypothetical protein n=1 Tax=Pseudonocardia sp. ICBG601 TaxID=2846759 RepID=UPI0027E298C2|nr:hypothetical protein [Pseudonocardia sp. ICBG601]
MLSESEEREGTQVKDGLKLIFTRYLPTFVMVGGVVVAWNVTNYMLTSYMPTYLETTVDQHGGTPIDSTTSSWLQIVVLWLAVFVIPLLGRLSDRIGRKPIMWTGAGGLIVLGIPMILLMAERLDPLGVPRAAAHGPAADLLLRHQPSTLPALFPTQIRYGGLSIAFNIFVSAFAGTVSLVMSAVVLATGDLLWPGYYLMAAG